VVTAPSVKTAVATSGNVSRALALLLAIFGNWVGMAWALGWSSIATPGDFVTLLATIVGFVVGGLVGAAVGYGIGIPIDRRKA